jgi:hypothetical protein
MSARHTSRFASAVVDVSDVIKPSAATLASIDAVRVDADDATLMSKMRTIKRGVVHKTSREVLEAIKRGELRGAVAHSMLEKALAAVAALGVSADFASEAIPAAVNASDRVVSDITSNCLQYAADADYLHLREVDDAGKTMASFVGHQMLTEAQKGAVASAITQNLSHLAPLFATTESIGGKSTLAIVGGLLLAVAGVALLAFRFAKRGAHVSRWPYVWAKLAMLVLLPAVGALLYAGSRTFQLPPFHNEPSLYPPGSLRPPAIEVQERHLVLKKYPPPRYAFDIYSDKGPGLLQMAIAKCGGPGNEAYEAFGVFQSGRYLLDEAGHDAYGPPLFKDFPNWLVAQDGQLRVNTQWRFLRGSAALKARFGLCVVLGIPVNVYATPDEVNMRLVLPSKGGHTYEFRPAKNEAWDPARKIGCGGTVRGDFGVGNDLSHQIRDTPWIPYVAIGVAALVLVIMAMSLIWTSRRRGDAQGTGGSAAASAAASAADAAYASAWGDAGETDGKGGRMASKAG